MKSELLNQHKNLDIQVILEVIPHLFFYFRQSSCRKFTKSTWREKPVIRCISLKLDGADNTLMLPIRNYEQLKYRLFLRSSKRVQNNKEAGIYCALLRKFQYMQLQHQKQRPWTLQQRIGH